jgi:hypothetical protein
LLSSIAAGPPPRAVLTLDYSLKENTMNRTNLTTGGLFVACLFALASLVGPASASTLGLCITASGGEVMGFKIGNVTITCPEETTEAEACPDGENCWKISCDENEEGTWCGTIEDLEDD